jgi:hypothetical protein
MGKGLECWDAGMQSRVVVARLCCMCLFGSCLQLQRMVQTVLTYEKPMAGITPCACSVQDVTIMNGSTACTVVLGGVLEAERQQIPPCNACGNQRLTTVLANSHSKGTVLGQYRCTQLLCAAQRRLPCGACYWPSCCLPWHLHLPTGPGQMRLQICRGFR